MWTSPGLPSSADPGRLCVFTTATRPDKTPDKQARKTRSPGDEGVGMKNRKREREIKRIEYVKKRWRRGKDGETMMIKGGD